MRLRDWWHRVRADTEMRIGSHGVPLYEVDGTTFYAPSSYADEVADAVCYQAPVYIGGRPAWLATMESLPNDGRVKIEVLWKHAGEAS